MSALLGYMARTDAGHTVHLTDPKRHPRGQLLAKLGRQHAQRMFIDRKSGPPVHIGYIVAGEWWTVYEVHEWSKPANL